MRFPLKLNRAFWPRLFCTLLPASDNPRGLLDRPDDATTFSRAVSTLKFGTTFKTTSRARYPGMIEQLSRLRFQEPPVILDVAASDGSASLAVMDAIEHTRYYLTDRNPVVQWIEHGGSHYFFDPMTSECLLCADRLTVGYADTVGALWPFGALARRKLARVPSKCSHNLHSLDLVNPEVRRQHPGLELQRHDIFEPWGGERPDIVIAANILNRNYFNDDELRVVSRNLLAALQGNGYLAVVDNRPQEHGSLFRLEGGKLDVVTSLNGGAAVETLVLEDARTR